MPANFNGYYKGLTRWTTATGNKEVSIILAIKQNAVAITDISVLLGENSGSIFDFGSYRTFEIVGNDLFERSSDQLSSYRYGKIGADGFYITDSDFAEIDVIKVANNGIHLRISAKQLSPIVFGTYEETQVKGVLFLIK
jgi:hypothetical protein